MAEYIKPTRCTECGFIDRKVMTCYGDFDGWNESELWQAPGSCPYCLHTKALADAERTLPSFSSTFDKSSKAVIKAIEHDARSPRTYIMDTPEKVKALRVASREEGDAMIEGVTKLFDQCKRITPTQAVKRLINFEAKIRKRCNNVCFDAPPKTRAAYYLNVTADRAMRDQIKKLKRDLRTTPLIEKRTKSK